MAIIYNTRTVRSGLVLYLDAANRKSYPGSGTIWTDLSGNGNNGTLTNGPTFSSANGGGILFDGINDNVDLANTVDTQFPHNSPWTVQMFVKIVSFTNTYPGFFRKGNSVSSGQIIFFSNDGNIFWKHNDQQGVIMTFTFNQPFMLTLTHNGSGTVRAYKNDMYTTTGVSMVSTESSSSLILGRADEYSNSIIYAFLKFNKQLSDIEIQQNFNATRDRYGI